MVRRDRKEKGFTDPRDGTFDKGDQTNGKVTHFATPVDEAHCRDTSRSLQVLIGQHSKVTSGKQGWKPTLVKQLLYRSDVSVHIPMELASLACTLQYSREAY